METTKSQRELTQKEASHLAAVNEQLRLDAERLEKQAETLETEKKDLSIRADRLLERQQLLEQCAESLRLENGILLQQFEKLKMKHDEEIAALEANIANIQKTASTMLQNFTEGKMNAQELIEGLAEVGVELQLPENELVAVQEKLNAANTTQERAEYVFPFLLFSITVPFQLVDLNSRGMISKWLDFMVILMCCLLAGLIILYMCASVHIRHLVCGIISKCF